MRLLFPAVVIAASAFLLFFGPTRIDAFEAGFGCCVGICLALDMRRGRRRR